MAELLAPAGSMETVLAAIDAGADAIYLGGKMFNARKFAHNLDEDELRRAVETAHLFGVRVYVAVNIIVADKELKDLAAYISFLDSIAVDGIIVQDLAAARIVHEAVPAMPLHGSTQMTVADIDGVQFLASLGFTQVVLSRELSIGEIRDICRQSPVPVEVFIHGAQCMSYSGQCLMSSFIGGRSGNRGACAQPCRLPYTLQKDERALMKEDACLLSLKDLNTAAYISELLDAGVASFKIEGRMKGSGYVRTIVAAYRKIIDSHTASERMRRQAVKEGQEALQNAFNRTYQHDFLTHTAGRHTITAHTGGNQGKRMGIVTSCRGTQADAFLEDILEAGDLVKICSADGEAWVDEIQEAIALKKEKGRFILVFRRHDIGKGTIFRLARREDRKNALLGLNKKILLYGHVDVNEKGWLRLTMWDEAGHTAVCARDFVPQPAQKHPATAAWIQNQLSRLGDTVFVLQEATTWDETYMIPASVLNQLRREAAAEIKKQILQEYVRPRPGNKTRKAVVKTDGLPLHIRKHPSISLRCDTLEAIEAAGKGGADRVIFGGESYQHQIFDEHIWRQAAALAKSYNMEIWAASPRVVQEEDRHCIEEELHSAAEALCDGIYAGSMSIFPMQERLHTRLPVYTDWSLHVFNSMAANAYAAMGCQGITVSPEATLRQIEYIQKHCTVPLEVLAAGRVEMMVTSCCSIAAFAGTGEKAGCPRVCRKGTYVLEDRKKNLFPIGTDQYCHMHILNSRDLDMTPYMASLQRAGISWLRIEGRGRDSQWISRQVRLYKGLADGTETMIFSKDNKAVTRGHFFHGIL